MAGTAEIDTPSQTDSKKTGNESQGMPRLGWAILLLTAATSINWSAHKLLEQDEIFSLQTDRVSSLCEVLRIQRLYPISLEPPPYHVLSHAAMAVFGPNAFALRLPALLGYLLMQVCLYFFVRNLIGSGGEARRAGLVAMMVPALTWTLYFSAEGRPYGLLLGSFAAAVLCWQISTRRGTTRTPRRWALIGLAAALALTLNVHFYGVLLLIVLYGAELTQTISRRKLDGSVLAALAVGTASLIATLPYIKASAEFKKHYYAGPISNHLLTQPYRQMLLDYTTYSKPSQIALIFLMILASVTALWRVFQTAKRKELVASTGEWAVLLLLLLLPVFAFCLGKSVTHALEVRHSIGAVIGISSVIAIALRPALSKDPIFISVMAMLIISSVCVNVVRIKMSAAASHELMRELTASPQLRSAINANIDDNIYFQNLGKWELASLYEPDPEIRSRIILVYSKNEEMTYEYHDTMYLTATHTAKFTPLKIVSYEDLRRSAGDHIFATYRSGWDWTGPAFAQEAETLQSLGKGFGGEVVKVRFKQ